jgi:formate hydrogenlyase subunit 3/multisubunit Na+/H+ antiporter MnhD subunit
MGLSDAPTQGGLLLVLAIMLPAGGILPALAFGGRRIERVMLICLPASLAIAAATFGAVWQGGEPLVYIVGGWAPPLGIALRADGVSAAMMVTTAIVICATALFARPQFRQPRGQGETRAPLVFWVLLLAIWSALNAVVLGGDLFTLYVALELLTFGAVPLVCLNGDGDTIKAALRYMLFALLGSVLYLLGTAMIFGAYGTLDIVLLSKLVRPEPVPWVAVALMTTGLLAKAALFPFHLWLPPAHAGAPAAGSAVLSALVVKGAFFLVVRLWFYAMPSLITFAAAQLIATLGAAAILFGSVLALRQPRLKLLVAYSTVAQIGYLFFIFPLAGGFATGDAASGIAWTGGWLQLFSHAFAKAAMFMAAGLIAEAVGHDRIADLGGIARALPISVIAFALAGLSLIGVPPSGGFVAKWLLLSATVTEGQWWWALVMLVGGLLAGGYVFMVLGKAFGSPDQSLKLRAAISRRCEIVTLAVALCAVLLGLLPLAPSDLLEIGRPAALDIKP